MNSLEGMLEFVAVVERGTFTRSARQMGVSVSHISRQIAELERRLQTQLFLRTTRQMQLTEPGTRFSTPASLYWKKSFTHSRWRKG